MSQDSRLSGEMIFLSKGSFGSVYRHSQGVAVKIIEHSDDTILFPMELSLMLTYKHPYINHATKVKCFTDHIKVFQTEALCNLREYLEEYSISKYLAKKWIFSLFSAISILHRDNIIHCDIKPKNILIFKGKELKISDFGFSMLLTDMIIPREPVGTLCYTAPEVLLTGIIRKEADIWSCGSVCYEILTKHRLVPLQSSTRVDKEKRKLSARYKTVKALQVWRDELGDDISPRLESLSHSPIVSKLIDNDLSRVVIDTMTWHAYKRPTAEQVLGYGIFSLFEAPIGKVKEVKILTTKSNHDETVDTYLLNRGMARMDKAVCKEIKNLYTRARNVLKNVEELLVIEAVLLIVFRLFHYHWDNFCTIEPTKRVRKVMYHIYQVLDFKLHKAIK